jgi:hypothetical protein
VSLSQLGEGLDWGPGGNGKVALDLALEGIEIGFQDLQLLIPGKRPQPKLLASASLLQHNLTGGLGVAHPLRPAARRHQEFLAADFEQIDGSGLEISALASAHLE